MFAGGLDSSTAILPLARAHRLQLYVTLQGGDCNFNLRTLGILNLLALGAFGGRDWNLEFGKYFEFARSAGGRDWNLGISSLQGALGAGIGTLEFGILHGILERIPNKDTNYKILICLCTK